MKFNSSFVSSTLNFIVFACGGTLLSTWLFRERERENLLIRISTVQLVIINYSICFGLRYNRRTKFLFPFCWPSSVSMAFSWVLHVCWILISIMEFCVRHRKTILLSSLVDTKTQITSKSKFKARRSRDVCCRCWSILEGALMVHLRACVRTSLLHLVTDANLFGNFVILSLLRFGIFKIKESAT